MARRHKETYVGGGSTLPHGLYGGDARGIYGGNGRRRRNSQMRIYSKAPKRWPRVALIVVIALIFILCLWQFACGGLPFFKAQEKPQGKSIFAVVEESIESARQKAGLAGLNGTVTPGLNAQITITAVGDCTFGKDPDFVDSTSFNAMYAAHGPAYFFANVVQYTTNDQLTIANCEGALTESNDIQQKTFNFKGAAEYARVFVDGGVEAVNLANNHSFDYSTSGYNDTKAVLQEYGITSFGYDRTATYEVEGIKIGLFGVNQLDGTEKATSLMIQDIDKLKTEGCSLIIGSFHWGIEGEYAPDETQVTMAHAAIDAGCDLVLGTHPHVLQGIEYYNQRYICYSLGNFCFGGNTNPMDFHTLIYQQTFNIHNGQFVPTKESRKAVRVVPCVVSSSTTINNYQPTPLTGADGTAAIEQLNSYTAMLKGDGAEFNTTLDEAGYSQVK